MPENPFDVLRLPPTASPEEVVRQGARLAQRAADETGRNRIRQAVRQLTGPDEERALHALLTHPTPEYDDPVLAQFQAAFRRPPEVAGGSTCPALDLEEVRGLLLAAVAAQLPPPVLPLEPIKLTESADEIARQTAEALWQSLIGQPRG
jgi:hypothetical protein